jgi:ABC-type Fe3+-siderophore transport system permease subunit
MEKISLLLETFGYGASCGFLATILRPQRPLWLSLIINFCFALAAFHIVYMFLGGELSDGKVKAIGCVCAIFSSAIFNIILSTLERIQKDPLTLILKLLGRK